MTARIRAGVIGHPIAHSKSPVIHNYWLERYAIEGEYKRYDIAPDNFYDEVMRLRDDGLAGLNVTLPHKQSIMDICTTLNDEAQKIGAVNTVVFYPGGEIEGRNTDAYGFLENAKESCPDFSWNKKTVTVLGAGGAARAILFALKREGVAEIRLSNRSIDHAEKLADEFGAIIYDWDEKEKALADTDALINSTSLGMAGKPELDMGLTALKKNAIVYDIVYTPLMTDLLKRAVERACPIVTGIGMLLHQARPGFEAWFGQRPEVTEELRQRIQA